MNPSPNLVFIGPMGAGKTSIGKRIAALMQLQFVDVDQRLEELTGARIPLIFECEGEAGFRARESALILQLCSRQGQLIATGGGAVLAEANRAALRANGFVVHLDVDVERRLRRLARDTSRPLLASGDRREILTSLAAQRGALYVQTADLRFDPGDVGVATAADRLYRLLASEWQRSTRASAADVA
ncbi:MAG: shikimate kinase [Lysobacteraceae bacterium]